MKFKGNFSLIILFVIATFLFSCFKPTTQKKSETKVSPENVQEQKIPIDSSLVRDTLNNGLVYYFKKNNKPKDRLTLRLVVHAGSVLEQKDERGIAHFDEHMAFNGTKHFEKKELVDYLESIGMRFGPDLNAYTSFDQTVYKLQLPTKEDSVVEKGFQILDDWASNISFNHKEIDKERKVIHEEWRSGRGALQRVREQLYPVLFNNSKYARRLPIGKMDVVDSCSYSTLTDFYNRWYRPNLMGVIAVGDYKKEKVDSLIQHYFSDNKNPDNAKERPYPEIPDHQNTKYVVETDSELPRTSLSIYIKHAPVQTQTKSDFRQRLERQIFTRMLRNRYKKITEQSQPPFVRAHVGASQSIHAKEFYLISAGLQAKKIEPALRSLLTEIKKINQQGFNQSELSQAKKEIQQRYNSIYKNRNDLNSRKYVNEYTNNYLFEKPVPGIEWEYKMSQQIIPQIDIQEVNNQSSELITQKNRVVFVAAPKKENIQIPSKNDLKQVVKDVKDSTLKQDKEKTVNKKLFPRDLPLTEIQDKKVYPKINTTEITLSNGVKVVYKPTDFKENQILMRAYSPGGTSLASDSNYLSAAAADDIVNNSGVAKFSESDLREILAGKKVNVSPYISNLTEGLKGSCGTEDVETMFKLINLYFTTPRKDSSGYQSYISKREAQIENRKANPRAAFMDTIRKTLTQNHFRARPPSQNRIKQIQLDSAFKFYQNRFADADDFTFFFTGNIDSNQIVNFSRKYLGNLPSLPRNEKWKDAGIDFPKGKITKSVHKGKAQKSSVMLVYSDKFNWSVQNNKKLKALESILNIRLRKKIREEEGGTYGVRCFTSISRYPDNEYKFYIYFGCSPDRAQELADMILKNIDQLQKSGPSDQNLKKTKNKFIQQRAENLEKNSYWISNLKNYYYYDLNPEKITEEIQYIKSLDQKDIKKTANKFFSNNIVEITLYPGQK